MVQESIPHDQWPSLLASFSRQYRSWPVSVEVRYREDEGQPVAREVALMGVSLDATEGIRIMLGEVSGSHASHLIPEPSGLAVLMSEDGGYEGLQIQARDGTTTVLSFKEPIRPETMDGVGPWWRGGQERAEQTAKTENRPPSGRTTGEEGPAEASKTSGQDGAVIGDIVREAPGGADNTLTEMMQTAPGRQAVRTAAAPVASGSRQATGNGASPRAAGLALVAAGQGVFYVVTGLWPVASIKSFEKITGPKREDWLVKTVGLLLAVVGLAIGLAGRRGRVTPEIALLGAGSAVTLAGVDVVYVSRGRLRPVYLLDALAELGLIAAWIAAWLLPGGPNHRS